MTDTTKQPGSVKILPEGAVRIVLVGPDGKRTPLPESSPMDADAVRVPSMPSKEIPDR